MMPHVMNERCMKETRSCSILTGFYKALKTMGMDPGLEFKVALEEAEKLNARYIALGIFHCLSLPVSCHTRCYCTSPALL